MVSREQNKQTLRSWAFPCKFFSAKREHQRPGTGANARGSSTMLWLHRDFIFFFNSWILFSFLFISVFWPGYVARGISVPWQGMDPTPLGAQSFNRWTPTEVPLQGFFFLMTKQFCYNAFTEETHNLTHQNAGWHGLEIQKLKHEEPKQTNDGSNRAQ